jgi:hypothetical protein
MKTYASDSLLGELTPSTKRPWLTFTFLLP